VPSFWIVPSIHDVALWIWEVKAARPHAADGTGVLGDKRPTRKRAEPLVGSASVRERERERERERTGAIQSAHIRDEVTARADIQ
jgi:hypothetical protein